MSASTAPVTSNQMSEKGLSIEQTLGEITQQDQDAHQREGAPWLAEVIPLQPEHESPAPMIDKMSASQRATLLIERLGEVAINMEAERVYHYSGSLWEPLTDTELRREMARLVGYGDFAALSLDAKMAGSADPVYALFDRVGAVAMEEAKAELYREQARRLRLENDEREEQT